MEFDPGTLVSSHVMSCLLKSDPDFSEVCLNNRQRELLLGKFVNVESGAYAALLSSPEYQIGVMVIQSSKSPWGLVRLLLNLIRYRRQVRGVG